MRHCIFWDQPVNIRSGRPTGYLAHLLLGLRNLNQNDIQIWLQETGQTQSHNSPPALTATEPTQEDIDTEVQGHINFFSNPNHFFFSDSEFERLLANDTRSVHLHTYSQVLRTRQTFTAKGITGIPIMFTSHSPESNAKELADSYRVKGANPTLTDQLEMTARNIEELCFKAADIWIFPSREAMEPYFQTIPEFENWSINKDIRFVTTGARAPDVSTSKEGLKHKYNIERKKVITFMGRHNSVKGYDLFCKLALSLLEVRDDIAVIVAGPESPSLPSPKHPYWLELGWFDKPGDLLTVSDVFVLPNRMTFYDLVLIEAISLQTVVLASATGGNKSVHDLTNGAVALYNNTSKGMRENLVSLLDDKGRKVREIKRKLEGTYETYFAPDVFAQNYANLIYQIWDDYNLGERG